MALKTRFGWVLSGAVNSKRQQGSETCCFATTSVDSASRGLYRQEIADHGQWWNGLSWLLQPQSHSPATPALADKPEPSKEKAFSGGLGLVSLAVVITDLPLLERTSDYRRLRRVHRLGVVIC